MKISKNKHRSFLFASHKENSSLQNQSEYLRNAKVYAEKYESVMNFFYSSEIKSIDRMIEVINKVAAKKAEEAYCGQPPFMAVYLSTFDKRNKFSISGIIHDKE